MEVLDLIRKQNNNIKLNVGEENEMTKIIEECRSNGIVPQNAYTIKRPELRAIQYFNSTEVQEAQTTPQSDLLKDAQYFTNIKSNLKLPYLKTDDVVWGMINPNVSELHCTSCQLQPKRVSTFVDVSCAIDVQNKSFNKDIANVLNKAIVDKVIETMFSNDEIDEAPKGLFAYKTPKALNQTNLFDCVLSVSKNKYNGTFILSPSAFIYLYTNCKDLFDNGKLIGFNYVVDGRVKDKFAAFIDLSKIVIADWTITSITIDNITKMKDGFVRVLAESYVDFNILDLDAIEVLKES